ncbi:iron uptake system protein EfeO [Paenibacillus sp. MBLB4367]|uniref:iron uptake system protein EfeO n=1 Tax=Paenibacillus sp. MBLB4367 TaxID=3384767 RepID=UPI00390841B6
MKARYILPAAMLGASLLFTGCQEKAGKDAGAAESEKTYKADTPELKLATETYRKYVVEQSDLFVKSTAEFVAAVKAGELTKAQQLYAPSRMFYERIEPIAESLGDLDPNLDAREDDVDEKEWRGFHRIEKALWKEKTTKGQETYADQLLSDSKLLRAKVETADINADMLVTGAVELLNEVSATKVTGEEERYSRTDLYDFAANVEGAKKIFEILKPELTKKDAALTTKIESKFTDLEKELSPFKKGDGYVPYNELTKDQTKKLSQAVDSLAEPLSNMGKLLEA